MDKTEKYHYDFSCRNYFGCEYVQAESKADAKIQAQEKVRIRHGCNNKCKVSITNIKLK